MTDQDLDELQVLSRAEPIIISIPPQITRLVHANMQLPQEGDFRLFDPSRVIPDSDAYTGTMTFHKGEVHMSDPKTPMAFPTTKKPLERLQLTVEFDTPMDHAALGEVIEAMKLYGTVTTAKHVVLRRHARDLV